MSLPGSSGLSKIDKKTSAGNRTDIGWEHGIDVNKNGKNVNCNYCKVTFSGGIFRFKHHLAGTRDNVKPCMSVPDDVKRFMLSILAEKFEVSKKRKKDIYSLVEDSVEEIEPENTDYNGKNVIENLQSRGSKNAPKQSTINEMMKKESREEVCQQIARFFYSSGIPFNCVNNQEFSKMLHLVGKYGIGLKAPSSDEIREKYLSKEVIRIKDMLDEYRIEWGKTGCSIMCNEWTNTKGLSICNFFVNSPKGTVFLFSIDTSDISKTASKVFEMLDDVVREVGVENVVQVMTYGVTNSEAAGKMLMETRKNLFWSPCVAHHIDVALEDFGIKLNDHHVTIAKAKEITTFIYSRTMLISMMKEFTKNKDLIRPSVFSFVTSYLTLGRVSELKAELMTMFSSPKWTSSRFSSLEVGKKVQSIIFDNFFWKNVNNCLKAANPLIRLLRMVDGVDKPSMGFIYQSMDRAKEEIQMNFENVKTRYEPIWEILNKIWEFQLHKPLHAAAYYLNPHFHYDPNFKSGFEIKKGLYECINTMVSNEEERMKIDLQLESFKNARGMFGWETAKLTRKRKSPAGWWDSYGDECPELQKFAVRVLSLTCGFSECDRNWSAFETLHAKKRNRLHQKRMNNLVFVMYNMKLMERQKKREAICYPSDSTEYDFDDFFPDNGWITENENPVLVPQKKWMRVLDKVAGGGNEDSDDDIRETREVITKDIRAVLDTVDDLVLHDDDYDEEENVGGDENNVSEDIIVRWLLT